ncbi:hypothetical protein [Marinimicrobium koreense]|uniref:hypothetical protein n=1 Tax=Marinimicrobium koreense TaxID=306545 RepID=UPI003F6E7BCB
MKQKNKLKLLIEYVSLFSFQLHVTTVLVAHHVKQNKDPAPLDLLVNQTDERESIIAWVHDHTPLRFNRKKKKFVHRGSGIWGLEKGLFSNAIIPKISLSRYIKTYRLRTLGDLSAVLSVVQTEMERLDKEADKDKSMITESDINNISDACDREKIRAYLAANPIYEGLGKFGLPQSKYRNGTYGLRSMELNEWSR